MRNMQYVYRASVSNDWQLYVLPEIIGSAFKTTKLVSSVRLGASCARSSAGKSGKDLPQQKSTLLMTFEVANAYELMFFCLCLPAWSCSVQM